MPETPPTRRIRPVSIDSAELLAQRKRKARVCDMVRKLLLMGSHEIRMRLGGISRQRVYQITSHRNFPAPVAVLEMGKVWLKDDVEAWIRMHRPDLGPED